MSLPSGTRFGPYEITALVGVGGMGEVYRARDGRLERDVAIKRLAPGFADDPERLARFDREARILATLNHPGICAVYDVGRHEGSPYLVLEWLEGRPLSDLLAEGPLPLAQAVGLAIQILQGLGAAHAKGLVHRDIKPANLLLTESGSLKILDFGLAKQQSIALGASGEPTLDASGRSLEGMLLGTVGYMSPEQVSGRPVDARSDLFSFGVVLYEMLSGHRPFARESAIETMSATLSENPQPCRTPEGALSPALRQVLDRCLQKDPELRPRDARELIPPLDTSLTGGGGGRWWLRLRQIPLPALLTLGVGTASAGLLLWGLGSDRPKALPSPRPTVVALPAKVLGDPGSAFLTDAIPDTLSTLLAEADGIDTKCPPSSLEYERVNSDPAKVAEAYRVDLLLFTTVTVQADHLVLNAQLVEVPTRKVRWASQVEGGRGAYNDLIRQAAVGIARALRPPGAPSVVLPGPAFRSETELALREGRHLERRYCTTLKEEDFAAALEALQRAQSMDPSSATLSAELGMLFNQKDARVRDPEAHRLALAWANRALELDSRCGLAWVVRCWSEACKVGKLDPDRLAEYAFKAVALSPGDVRSHLALGAMAPTNEMIKATGFHVMELDPLDEAGYNQAALGLMDTGRTAEAFPILRKALRLHLFSRRGTSWILSRALFKMGRNEEALKAYMPGWEAGLLGDLLRRDLPAARMRGIKLTSGWRAQDAPAFYWANRAYFVAPLLVRAGLREEALWVLQMAADTRGPMNLDQALLDPDLRQLRGDPRYHQAVAVYRENALCFLKWAEVAEAQGELPKYLKPSVANLRELVHRPL